MAHDKQVVDLDPKPDDLPGQEMRWALEYFLASYDETQLKTKREGLRDNLKQWILDNCEQDENGNYIYIFDKPLQMDDTSYQGIMAQRRVSEYVNDDKAYEIAEKYNVLDQVTEEVVTTELNLDAMYRLNQSGVISDEDIDSILELKESFALVKMTEG